MPAVELVLEAGSPAPVPVPQASGPPAPLGWASRIAENAGSSGVRPNLQTRFRLLAGGGLGILRSPEDVWRAGERVDGSTFHHENEGEWGSWGSLDSSPLGLPWA